MTNPYALYSGFNTASRCAAVKLSHMAKNLTTAGCSSFKNTSWFCVGADAVIFCRFMKPIFPVLLLVFAFTVESPWFPLITALIEPDVIPLVLALGFRVFAANECRASVVRAYYPAALMLTNKRAWVLSHPCDIPACRLLINCVARLICFCFWEGSNIRTQSNPIDSPYFMVDSLKWWIERGLKHACISPPSALRAGWELRRETKVAKVAFFIRTSFCCYP